MSNSYMIHVRKEDKFTVEVDVYDDYSVLDIEFGNSRICIFCHDEEQARLVADRVTA